MLKSYFVITVVIIVSSEELMSLRYPAIRFLNREDLSNLQKINHLKAILKQFEEKNVNTIPINDIEAIHNGK